MFATFLVGSGEFGVFDSYLGQWLSVRSFLPSFCIGTCSQIRPVLFQFNRATVFWPPSRYRCFALTIGNPHYRVILAVNIDGRTIRG